MNLSNTALLGALTALSGMSALAGDITLFDKVSGNAFGSDARPGIQEDNETEPGTISNQSWDLEAFHLNGTTLSMIGGFNFLAGNAGQASGDIFIDTNGDAVWGTDTGGFGLGSVLNSVFKYDYVIHFTGRTDQTITGAYEVYSLSSATDTSVYYQINQEANPWKYESGGALVGGPYGTGTAVQTDLGTSNYGGLTGGQHFKFGGIDLSFLTPTERAGALFKFTMECGNDNLIGRVPDGGATILLMSAGLTGLGLVRRRLTLV